MAREQTYSAPINQQVMVHDAPEAHASPDDFGTAQGAAALGQGISNFGQAVAQTNIEQQERAAMAWSAQAVGQAHSDMLQSLLMQKNNAQPGAPGFTDEFAKTFDDYANKMIGNAPTVAAKQFAADRMGTLRARMVDSAQYFQENEQGEYELSQYHHGIQDATNAAVMDPTQLPSLMASMKATYANAPVQPAIKRRLDEQVMQMPYAVMDSVAENNPATAKAMLAPSLGLSPPQGSPLAGNPSDPRGIRNNNPGNLRASDTAWEGKIGNDGSFEQFATPEAGVRASMVNLRNSIMVHGNNTLGSVINAWAPSSENDTPAYIRDVSQSSGVGSADQLDPNNKDQMTSVLKGIFAHENGGKMPSDQAMQTGIDAAFGQGKLPSYQNPQGNDLKTGMFNVDSIPVQQRIQLYNKANSQMEKSNTLFRQQIDQKMRDDMAQAVNGVPVSAPISNGSFTTAFGDVEGPVRAKVYNNALAVGQAQNSMYTLTNDQINGKLADLKPQEGGGFAQEQEQYNHLVTAAQNVVSARMKDPQTFAQTYGLGPQVKLDPSNPQQLAQGIQTQVTTAHTMASKYGTPFKPLGDQQAAYMGAFFNATDPNTAVKTLQGIVSGAKDPDDASAIFSQMKINTPVVAKAGDILAHGDTSDTAATLVQGNQLLKQKGAMNEYVGKPAAFSQAFDQVTQGAYAGMPQDRSQDQQAVMAYYAQKQATAGVPAGEGMPPDPKLMKEAVKAVVGDTDVWNGQNVITPRGMSADDFHDTMDRHWDNLMTKNGIPPEQAPMSSVNLMRLSDGEYAVMHGNGPLKNSNGLPAIISFKAGVPVAGPRNHPAFAIQTPAQTEDATQPPQQTEGP